MNCYPPKILTINIYRSNKENMIFHVFIRIAKFIIIIHYNKKNTHYVEWISL